MNPIIRQGDVLIIPCESSVVGCKLAHLTLAEGEVTGHSHPEGVTSTSQLLARYRS